MHAEPGVPDEELAALADAGCEINRWPDLNHYFGGVTGGRRRAAPPATPAAAAPACLL